MRTTEEMPQVEEEPLQLAPIAPDAPYALRMMLIRRYWHLALKFWHPYISDSGRHEASWIGGDAIADTEEELIGKVLCAMENIENQAPARAD
jgi:hypothetical protein